MSRFVFVALVINLLTSAAFANDSSASASDGEASQSSFPVHEDLWDAMSDDPSHQLGMARQAYLSVDIGAAAQRLRKAAANVRITSNQADATMKPELKHSADELDALARQMDKGHIKSVRDLDQPSARALRRLARHHYLMARRLWLQKQTERAGKQMRAAADSLEHAAELSGREIQATTKLVVTDVRLISGKLIEGMGYGVDEVGKGFESLGRQVESVGKATEPAQGSSLR